MKLKQQFLPVTICSSLCPTCGNPVDDYPMFESGPGGEFATWVSVASSELYRINCGFITYEIHSLLESMEPIIEHAGGRDNLRHIPEELYCKFCSKVFHAESCSVLREEHRNAYDVVPNN